MYEELVKRLRERADWINFPKHGEELPVEEAKLMYEAADAIEQLGKKLCDWCGVCPEGRRRIWECEIAFPNAEVPEVWIEPPKEETE